MAAYPVKPLPYVFGVSFATDFNMPSQRRLTRGYANLDDVIWCVDNDDVEPLGSWHEVVAIIPPGSGHRPIDGTPHAHPLLIVREVS